MQISQAQEIMLEGIKQGEISSVSNLEPEGIINVERLLENKLVSGTKGNEGYLNLKATVEGETYLVLLQPSLELPWYVKDRVALFAVMVVVPLAIILMKITIG